MALFWHQQRLKQKEHTHNPANKINQTVFIFLYFLSGLFVFRFWPSSLKTTRPWANYLIPWYPSFHICENESNKSTFLLVSVVSIQLDNACKVLGMVSSMSCKFSQCHVIITCDHGRDSQQCSHLLLLSLILWLIYFPVSLLWVSSRKKNINSKIMRSLYLVSQHLSGKYSDF